MSFFLQDVIRLIESLWRNAFNLSYPPVDALSSLSRLMRHGAGPGHTRADHLDLAAQVLAALARARQARELADLVGEDARGPADRAYLRFAAEVEHRLLDQRVDESRPLEDTLDRAWDALAVLPRRELTMLPAGLLDTHLRSDPDGG